MRVLVPLVVLLAVSACSGGGASVPEGFEVVEHPLGTVAVPEDWELTDEPSGSADMYIDEQRFLVPGVEEIPAGVSVFEGNVDPPQAEGATSIYGFDFRNAGAEQTRREEIEIAGAEAGFLLQYEAESEPLGGELARSTLVAAESEGRLLMLQFLGTEEQIGDELIDEVVASMEVTGG